MTAKFRELSDRYSNNLMSGADNISGLEEFYESVRINFIESYIQAAQMSQISVDLSLINDVFTI